MASQALYRKWRSQTFNAVVGQHHVTQTLLNALKLGRVGHAYLFTGPRGTGKTSTARLLAKAVNCLAENSAERPCNVCSVCCAINEGRLLDLIEIDAASNTGVDDIRDLRDKVGFRPSEAKYKFYVIDECFRYEDLVTLADGVKLPIGKIVNEKLHVDVLSYNEQTKQIEPKPIVRHMQKQPELPAVRITFDNNRVLVCTINHKFYTPNGLRRAGELDVGHFVYTNQERITKHQFEVVAGAALGDGHVSLTNSQMRARLSISQGVAQKEYLDYKVQLLGDLVHTLPQYHLSPKSYSKKGIYHLSTVSRPQIAELHRELYPDGKKHVSYAYLKQITPLGLALWYLDDGSLITQVSRYHRKKDGMVSEYLVMRSTLSTNSFSVEEVELILEWLKEKWHIGGGYSVTAKGPVIWLTVEGTKRLHEIIAPYVPPSMEYKLLAPYRGRFIQPTDNNTLSGLAVSVVRKIERVVSPEIVYNVEVADNHNYFVRDILVANCHMLSNSAFNALLKTLEEPPPHVIFVLATTEPEKIPATITSRCQRFDFKRISVEEVAEHLAYIVKQEGLSAEPTALAYIAKQGGGSMRDAISLLDQLTAYGGETITLELVRTVLGAVTSQVVVELIDALINEDVAKGLDIINRVVSDGVDSRQFAREIVEYLRMVMLVKLGSGGAFLNLPEETLNVIRTQASRANVGKLVRATTLFNKSLIDLKSGLLAIPQLPLELAFVEVVIAIATASLVAPEQTTVPKAILVEPKHEPKPIEVTTESAQFTVGAVRERFEQAVKYIEKKNKIMAEALRNSAILQKIVDNRIYFTTEDSWKVRFEKPQPRSVLDEAFSMAMERSVSVRFLSGDSAVDYSETQRTESSKVMVKMATEELGGQISS